MAACVGSCLNSRDVAWEGRPAGSSSLWVGGAVPSSFTAGHVEPQFTMSMISLVSSKQSLPIGRLELLPIGQLFSLVRSQRSYVMKNGCSYWSKVLCFSIGQSECIAIGQQLRTDMHTHTHTHTHRSYTWVHFHWSAKHAYTHSHTKVIYVPECVSIGQPASCIDMVNQLSADMHTTYIGKVKYIPRCFSPVRQYLQPKVKYVPMLLPKVTTAFLLVNLLLPSEAVPSYWST